MKSAETSRREGAESLERVREKHLALTLASVDTEDLRDFLEHYAPLQLLADRSRATKIRLSRKLLSAGSHMFAATSLVSQAQAASGNPDAIDRLLSSLVVDKRTTLPHPAWTTKHDAVLVLAIAKHGWIDQEASIRAIIDDPSVTWGAPFEAASGDGNSDDSPGGGNGVAELVATGMRAAVFLSGHSDVLEEIKGFNMNLVVRAYSLVRQTDDLSDSPELDKAKGWAVADSLVEQSKGVSSEQTEPVELPPKKDLLKRVKTVLTRSNGATGGTATASASAVPPIVYNFAVVDQSDTRNILLAEMLRSVLKTPSTLKSCKKLCHLALLEAQSILGTLQPLSSAGAGAKPSKLVEEMLRIEEHIELVKSNLKKNARQAKNVVRVMLGDEPHHPRGPNEVIFPVKRAALVTTTAARFSSTTSGGTKTSGEKAFDAGKRRAANRSHGGEADAVIELTEIETLILQVVSSNGIPLHSDPSKSFPAGASVVSATEDGMHGVKYNSTWLTIGRSLTFLAQGFRRKEAEKARKAQQEVENSTLADVAKAQKVAFEAESSFEAAELAANQATAYLDDPESLAKKTVMMLNKLRKHVGQINVTAASSKFSDNGLGARVLTWSWKEVEKWSSHLELVDEEGAPFAFTAVDFLNDIPEDERVTVQITSVFDKKGCRAVLSQIATVSRIRSVYASYTLSELLGRLERATNNIKLSGDSWAVKPEWWETPCQSTGSIGHDGILLERLLKSGFNTVRENKDTFSYFDLVRCPLCNRVSPIPFTNRTNASPFPLFATRRIFRANLSKN